MIAQSMAESITQAAQCAELLASTIRDAHKAACADGGPMEYLLRETLADAHALLTRLKEFEAFA